jgi:hypothetical protein
MTDSFNLKIDSFEALVDLEMALDGYIDELAGYRYPTDREAETFRNLIKLRTEVMAMRVPITRERKLMRELASLPC